MSTYHNKPTLIPHILTHRLLLFFPLLGQLLFLSLNVKCWPSSYPVLGLPLFLLFSFQTVSSPLAPVTTRPVTPSSADPPPRSHPGPFTSQSCILVVLFHPVSPPGCLTTRQTRPIPDGAPRLTPRFSTCPRPCCPLSQQLKPDSGSHPQLLPSPLPLVQPFILIPPSKHPDICPLSSLQTGTVPA